MKENYSKEQLRQKVSFLFKKPLFVWVCIIVGLFFQLATTNAQTTPKLYSFSIQDKSISEVLKQIEQDSQFYVFFYNENIKAELEKKVSMDIQTQSIVIVLENLFMGTDLKYDIANQQILIYSMTPDEREITGMVTDKEGISLPGANVVIKGTTKGVSTNLDGNYKIKVPINSKEPVSLVFSFLGMATKQVTVRRQQQIDVVLQEDENLIEEVVVTGIFNRPKESFTGAAVLISKDKLEKAGSRNVITSIQNIDPTFKIAQNLDLGSDPNRLPAITMRGRSALPTGTSVEEIKSNSATMINANMPLFILDGFEITVEQLYDMDNNRIENITILKDASAAALYGTRGANGVVVITSKQPEAGRLRVSYSGGLHVETPDFTSYNLMDAKEKLQFELMSGLYEGTDVISSQKLQQIYNERAIDIARGVDTYWLKYPVHTGVGHRHNLSLDGGDKTMRYVVGVDYNKTEGVMKGSSRNTLNANVSLLYKVKNLTFRNMLLVGSTKSNDSPYGAFSDFGARNPYLTPYDDDNNVKKILFDDRELGGTIQYNPLYNALLPQKQQAEYFLVTNNFSIEWHLLPTVFLRSRFSIARNDNSSDSYTSMKNTKYENSFGEEQLAKRGEYIYTTGISNNYSGELTLNFSKKFNDKHVLFVGLGSNVSETSATSFTIVGQGFTNPDDVFLGQAQFYPTGGRPSGSESTARNMGVFYSGNFNYAGRYILDTSFKVEGSSRFGGNNKFANFWSVGAGWNLKNESFLIDVENINSMRIRSSYGLLGSLGFDPYQAKRTYTVMGGTNYLGQNGVVLKGLGNPDLKWQRTYTLNLGVDVTIFDFLTLVADAYNKTTKELLTNISIPTATGFQTYRENLGDVENKGIDGSATITILDGRNTPVWWQVGTGIAYNINTIKKISESLRTLNEQIIQSEGSSLDPSVLFEEGQSLNTLYVVPSKGIDPSTGREVFVKKDGSTTYEWRAEDKVPVGTADPKFNGRIHTSVRYKGFLLTTYFGYHFGGIAYNSTLASKVENINQSINNDRRAFSERWKQPGDIALFKNIADRTPTYASSRFVMKDRFFSLQSVNLEYQVPENWARRYTGASSLAVSANTEELFYAATIEQERGISYPFSRKFAFLLRATF